MFDSDSTAPLDGDGGGLSGGSVAAGLGAVLDAFGELTGCDRATLDELVGRVRPCEQLSARRLLDRIDAAERLAHGVQAFQVGDLAAFGTARDRGD